MTDPPEHRPSEDLIVEYGTLNDLHSDAAQALLLLGGLRFLTQWDDETLCAQLGCHPDAWMSVGGTPTRDKGALAHSLLFLSLVSEVAQHVDRTVHRREVVNAAAQVSADAGGPVAERVPRIRAALNQRPDDDLTPLELLDLGEIGKAWRAVAVNLGFGRAFERAVAASQLTAPVAAETAHLSPERLTLLAHRNAEMLLGPNVAKRMHEHLVGQHCAKCRSAAEAMGLSALLRSTKYERSAAA